MIQRIAVPRFFVRGLVIGERPPARLMVGGLRRAGCHKQQHEKERLHVDNSGLPGKWAVTLGHSCIFDYMGAIGVGLW